MPTWTLTGTLGLRGDAEEGFADVLEGTDGSFLLWRGCVSGVSCEVVDAGDTGQLSPLTGLPTAVLAVGEAAEDGTTLMGTA